MDLAKLKSIALNNTVKNLQTTIAVMKKAQADMHKNQNNVQQISSSSPINNIQSCNKEWSAESQLLIRTVIGVITVCLLLLLCLCEPVLGFLLCLFIVVGIMMV